MRLAIENVDTGIERSHELALTDPGCGDGASIQLLDLSPFLFLGTTLAPGAVRKD
jgi:hypothetical protein